MKAQSGGVWRAHIFLVIRVFTLADPGSSSSSKAFGVLNVSSIDAYSAEPRREISGLQAGSFDNLPHLEEYSCYQGR